MKLKSLYTLALVALMAACTEDYTDWAAPQQNDQPAIVTFGNGSVSAAGPVDFADIAEGQEWVKVCNVVAPTASSADYDQVSYRLNLENASYDLDNNGAMLVEDLKDYIVSNYGKAPYERELKATVEQWIGDGGTAVKTATSDEFVIKATLVAPVIESAYYLVGDMIGWSEETMVKFNRSSKDVYDDPYFTVVFETTEENQYWKIIPQSNVDAGDIWKDGVLGTVEDGDPSFEGNLVNSGAKAGKIEEPGKYRLTLNMMEYTYKIEKLMFPAYIYAPGNAQGWDPKTAAALKGDDNGVFTGFIVMDGDFKFTHVRDWAGEYNNSHFTTCSDVFDLGDQGGGNISFSGEPGLYYFTVDVAAGDLSAQKVETMSLIGDFNTWGDDDVMTWNPSELCFEKTGATVTASGWKFRMNYDWVVNLGGTVDDLVQNGANLDVVGSTIKLYPCRTTSDNIYCTVE